MSRSPSVAPIDLTDGNRPKPAAANSLGERVRSLRLPDEQEMRQRGKGRLALWCGLLLFAVAVGYYAWNKNWFGGKSTVEVAENDSSAESAEQKSTTTKSESKSDGGTVRPASYSTPTATNSRDIPVASSGSVALEAKGYVIPAHQILVSPMVSGRIVRLSLEEGRRVEQGEVLAELETTEYDADMARAEALLASAKHHLAELERGNRPEEIAAAKAELGEAEAQREQLRSDWKRKTQLRETKVATETEYEIAESQFKAMDRRVARLQNTHKLMVEGPRIERINVAKAEVAQAEAERARATWRLGNCTIKAPIAGTILKKNAEEGNIVNPIAFNGSFSLCEMADLSDLEVELSIQERDISRVTKGQRCKVRSDAYPDRMYDGVVSRLMPIADRAKGAVTVRVKLSVPAEEEGVYLKPEMGAIVSFLQDEAAKPQAESIE